jgi:hypothetical protein
MGSPRTGLKTEVSRQVFGSEAQFCAIPRNIFLRLNHPPTPPPPLSHSSRQVDQLFARVQEHDDAIIRLDACMEKNAAIADDSLKAVQASLKASLASLRDEMNRKLQALTIEIAQLQKQMNVARGEQSILAQQQKDTAKRVDIVSSTVSELSAEIVGDESAPSIAAVQGAAY